MDVSSAGLLAGAFYAAAAGRALGPARAAVGRVVEQIRAGARAICGPRRACALPVFAKEVATANLRAKAAVEFVRLQVRARAVALREPGRRATNRARSTVAEGSACGAPVAAGPAIPVVRRLVDAEAQAPERPQRALRVAGGALACPGDAR